MRKLMILDPQEQYAEFLRECLGHCCQIIVCNDYESAAESIAAVNPDYLILDFTASQFEGFTVLRTAKSFGSNPAVIAIIQSSYYFNAICLSERSIASTIARPINQQTIANRLSLMMGIPQEQLVPLPSRRQFVFYMLSSLGIVADSLGCQNLLDIIPMKADHPNRPCTKDLYPEAGDITGHSGENVERNIRTAIENGWKNGDRKIWAKYFSDPKTGEAVKPKNSEFIKIMANVLNMQKGHYLDE